MATWSYGGQDYEYDPSGNTPESLRMLGFSDEQIAAILAHGGNYGFTDPGFGPSFRPATDDWLRQFALNRPWAQDTIRQGNGYGNLLRVLGTIGEEDFYNYSSEDQNLIRLILSAGQQLPAWMQSAGPENSFNDYYLSLFSQNRPWAQDTLRRGGYAELLRVLGTIGQSDFNNYSQDDQNQIQRILQNAGMLPTWMGESVKFPGASPTPSPNLSKPSIPNGGGGVIGGGGGITDIYKQEAYSSLPNLNVLSTNMGNTPGQVSPFKLGSKRGGAFGRRSPTGYQGY